MGRRQGRVGGSVGWWEESGRGGEEVLPAAGMVDGMAYE